MMAEDVATGEESSKTVSKFMKISINKNLIMLKLTLFFLYGGAC